MLLSNPRRGNIKCKTRAISRMRISSVFNVQLLISLVMCFTAFGILASSREVCFLREPGV